MATLAVLRATPTSLAGLLAFCQFGKDLSDCQHSLQLGGLEGHNPGASSGLDLPDAEVMFFAALVAAAQRLLPAGE